MMLARHLEEKLASLYRSGRIVGGVYIGSGQEAVSASLAHCLVKGDIYGPLIRDQAGRIGFGEPITDCTRTYFGSVHGPMRGRDGNVHRGRPREGMPAMISHLGSLISVVTGMLMARRMRGDTRCVGATSIGDGATSTGSFHEGLNLAAVERLPLVLLIANNQYAYSTPTSRQFVCRDLVDKAAGYGVEGHTCDGTDLYDCLEVMEDAVDRARNGRGPQLVVSNFLRLSGHGEHDDAFYVSEAMRRSPFAADCLVKARAFALEKGWLDESELKAIEDEHRQKVQRALAVAQRDPGPDPHNEDWRALSSFP